jgi:peroxiredoxin
MFGKFVKSHSKSLSKRNYIKELGELDVKPSKSIKLFNTDAKPITTDDLFSETDNVVVFGLPGAFTPTCSNKHVPSFLKWSSEV